MENLEKFMGNLEKFVRNLKEIEGKTLNCARLYFQLIQLL
ncbi:unnamed protein product [Ceutorhynchus assimilis]|uniref:Uncharacterized protein n=1 Tax=Ceutorhynchus assimilis TaxID=467358 RepID=A0A9N9QQ42_9CUCU|nr:unnamed protein product [Ceutorhynchus assimilis]